MKKFVAMLLVAVFCLIAAVGCGTGTSDVTTTQGTTAGKTGAPSAQKPDTPAKVVWYWNEGNVQLPDDSYICKKIKEDLNIEYVHISPKGTDYEERLQLLLASRDIPDVITSYNTLTSNLVKWGVVQPLEKYLTNDYISNVIRVEPNWDTAVKYLTRPDGHIYSIPNCNRTIVAETPFIRYDWLKNLGLEVPKTYDELKKVLDQFTKNDPDKNGKNDTVGTMANEFYGLQPIAVNFAAAPDSWYKDGNGGVTLGMFLPRHKDYVKYVKSLIDSGALSKELATTKFDNVIEKLKAGKVGFLFTWNDFRHNKEIIKVQPEADWRPMTPPKGVYDQGYLPSAWLMREEYCISSQCKNIDAVFKLMNYMANDTSTEEKMDYTGSYWPMKYGEPGVNWEITSDGKIDMGSVNKALEERNKADTWAGRTRRFISKFDMTWKLSLTPDELKVRNEIDSYPLSINIPDSDSLKSINVEPLVMPDNASQFSQEWLLVKWTEFFYKAILGKVDIDQGFADFVAEADKAGVKDINDTMLKALQAANLLK